MAIKQDCCSCKDKNKKTVLTLQDQKTLALASVVVTPLCPDGYTWNEDQQKCIKNPIPVIPQTWNCTPIGCVDPGDGSGQYATLAECQNNCILTPPPSCFPTPIVTIDPPSGDVISSTTFVFLHCNRTDAQIYYTLDGTIPTTSSTLYTGPFLLTTPASTSVTFRINAVGIIPSCDYGPVATAIYNTFPFETISSDLNFEFICNNADKAGIFGVFSPNGSPDYNWHLLFTTSGDTIIKRIEIYETDENGVWITGQAWATDEFINPDEGPANFHVFPLVIFDDGLSPNISFSYSNRLKGSYVPILGTFPAGVYKWTMTGQPFIPLSAGYFKIKIILGTEDILFKVIRAVCVPSDQTMITQFDSSGTGVTIVSKYITTFGVNPAVIAAPALNNISKVTIAFNGFAFITGNPTSPIVVQLLLTSPSGKSIILWNTYCGGIAPSLVGVYITPKGLVTFDDSATSTIPEGNLSTTIVPPLTVQPTQYGDITALPAIGAEPGVALPFSNNLAALIGNEPAGNWKVHGFINFGATTPFVLHWDSISLYVTTIS